MTRMRVGVLEERLSATLHAVDRRGCPSCVLEEEEEVTVLPATRPFAPIRDRNIPELRGCVDSLALLRAERGTR
jgi:hypothetical protein